MPSISLLKTSYLDVEAIEEFEKAEREFRMRVNEEEEYKGFEGEEFDYNHIDEQTLLNDGDMNINSNARD